MVRLDKNKKGWVRIVESFMAVMLIMGIVIILVSSERLFPDEMALKAENAQAGILREIQLNDTLRGEILGVDLNSRVVVGENNQLTQLNRTLNNRIVETFFEGCVAQICMPGNSCEYDGDKLKGKDVYAQSVLITADSSTFSPRILKLFCW